MAESDRVSKLKQTLAKQKFKKKRAQIHLDTKKEIAKMEMPFSLGYGLRDPGVYLEKVLELSSDAIRQVGKARLEIDRKKLYGDEGSITEKTADVCKEVSASVEEYGEILRKDIEKTHIRIRADAYGLDIAKELKNRISEILSDLKQDIEIMSNESVLGSIRRSKALRYGKKELKTSQKAGLLDNTFRKEGDFWTIVYEGKTIRLKDTKGLQYIGCLLHHAGQKFSALELILAIEKKIPVVGKQPYNDMTQEQLEEEGLRHSDLGNAGEILSKEDVKLLREQMAGIEKELNDAKALNDTVRAALLENDKQALRDQLFKAFGLRGRHRKAVDVMERIRKNVSVNMHRALKKIKKEHHGLGRHLGEALKIGSILIYSPYPEIRWTS